MTPPGRATQDQAGRHGAGPILFLVIVLQMLDRVESWFLLRGPIGLPEAPSMLAALLPCVAGAIPCGWLAGWLGKRRALVALLLVWAVVSLGTVAPLPPAPLLLLRLVAGTAQAGLLPIAVAITLSGAVLAERARALCWVMVPASAGPAVAVGLLPTGASLSLGPRIGVSFLFIGLAALVLARQVWRTVPDTSGDVRRREWPSRPVRRAEGDGGGFVLAGLMVVEAGLTLSGAAATIWMSELWRDSGIGAGPCLAVLAYIGGVVLVTWSSRVDRQGRWGAALVSACALATMGYAAGTLKGISLQKFAGLAAQAAGVAVGRSMIRGLAAPLAQGRLGVVRLAAIDMAGLTAVAATPRFVEWLSDAGENLQFGLLAIILVLMATTLVASLLTFTQD